MTPSRCAAIYARISTEKQNPLSPDDQIRKCREYADAHGLVVLPEHIYRDDGFSGAGADRPALNQLLDAAFSGAPPFTAILVDDTSRLSRSTKDSLSIFERLNFAGVQLVAVSQGIDSHQDQAEVLVTVHGMVDALYLRELAKKTHRGLEGRVLKGLHAGGRCYGYKNTPVSEGGVKLEIEESEAAVVRRIFDMSASGYSLKTIAKTFNAEKLPPPRRRADRPRMTWCPTAIHAMLRRELYVGRIVWNHRRFIKRPGTNKRVSRPRPASEWRIVERPELRIVSEATWAAVQARLRGLRELGVGGRRAGLLNRSATSPYLFSGLLKCSLCGGNLVIATGHTPGRSPKYGCSQHHYRGACTNGVYVRRDWLEQQLLGGLQEQVLRPEVIEHTMEEFARQFRAAASHLVSERANTQRHRERIQLEIGRLIEAVADVGRSAQLVEQIRDRERQLRELSERMPSDDSWSVESALLKAREFVGRRLSNLCDLLRKDVVLARTELRSHVADIRMVPCYPADGKPYYVAEGEWGLLGNLGPKLPPSGGSIRMVAGVGFEPTTFGL